MSETHTQRLQPVTVECRLRGSGCFVTTAADTSYVTVLFLWKRFNFNTRKLPRIALSFCSFLKTILHTTSTFRYMCFATKIKAESRPKIFSPFHMRASQCYYLQRKQNYHNQSKTMQLLRECRQNFRRLTELAFCQKMQNLYWVAIVKKRPKWQSQIRFLSSQLES